MSPARQSSGRISVNDQILKIRTKFSKKNRRRALEDKSWEISILHQVAFFRASEDASLHEEGLAQLKTLHARTRELAHRIKCLEYNIKMEEVEVNVCEDQANGVLHPSLPQSWRTEVCIPISHSWYLERAQKHRDRAQQLEVTKDNLVITMKELKLSAKNQLLASDIVRGQIDDLPRLSATVKKSDMRLTDGIMFLVLHNNLLTLLEAQKKATAHQQEATTAQVELCRLQQKSTSRLQQKSTLMKEYYKKIM